MLCLLRRWLPDRDLVVVADRTYATLKLLAACQALTPPITFLTRLRLDAVLHDPPPPRRPGQKGRPRIVGPRQPSLQALLTDPDTKWTALCQRWPDGTQRHLQAATGTALWYHSGEPTVSLRWLLLRDPSGCREPQALLCTDPKWTPAAIARTTPALLGLSAGSSWSPTACGGSVACVPAESPGMPRPCPPSPTSWRVSATPSGPGCSFFPCPRPPPTSKNFPSRRPHPCWPPSATRPDTRPRSPCPHGLCTKSS